MYTMRLHMLILVGWREAPLVLRLALSQPQTMWHLATVEGLIHVDKVVNFQSSAMGSKVRRPSS